MTPKAEHHMQIIDKRIRINQINDTIYSLEARKKILLKELDELLTERFDCSINDD